MPDEIVRVDEKKYRELGPEQDLSQLEKTLDNRKSELAERKAGKDARGLELSAEIDALEAKIAIIKEKPVTP